MRRLKGVPRDSVGKGSVNFEEAYTTTIAAGFPCDKRAAPHNVFDFMLNRGRDRPNQFLQDYAGVLLGAREAGGRRAILAGLSSTSRRRQIDPQLYLTQLLMNLPSWPLVDLDAWLPGQWKLGQAARLAALYAAAPAAW